MNSGDKFLMVKKLLEEGEAEKARELFAEIGQDNSVEYHFTEGIIRQKFQHWGDAINSFQQVIELDPNNTEAKNHIRMIQSILTFWNPETFNP